MRWPRCAPREHVSTARGDDRDREDHASQGFPGDHARGKQHAAPSQALAAVAATRARGEMGDHAADEDRYRDIQGQINPDRDRQNG